MEYEFSFDEAKEDRIASQVQEEKSSGKTNSRIIVCEHWLLGLCQYGRRCEWLHRYDLNKMPICKRYLWNGVCKVRNCPQKHGDIDTGDCVFYKQGFCYFGSECKHRHLHKPAEECPSESTFETNHQNKRVKVNDPNENYKVTLCSHALADPQALCKFGDECHFAHDEEDIQEGQQAGSDMLYDDDIYDPTRGRLDANLYKEKLIIDLGNNRRIEMHNDLSIEYFLLQAPDLLSLSKAKRLQKWAVPRRTCEELNEAFSHSEHVILFFSVRSMKGIYGVARMDGPVPPPVVGSDFSREFPIQWMRTLRIRMRTVAQMKTGMSGIFIGKAKGDCPIGDEERRRRMSPEAREKDISYHDIFRIAYRKPMWDWAQDFEMATKGKLLPTGESTIGEVFPGAIAPGSDELGPDQLFTKQWEKTIVQASYEMPAKGMGIRRLMPKTTFYKSDYPGFVFCAGTAIIDEMFSK